jgi:hypothetical protein
LTNVMTDFLSWLIGSSLLFSALSPWMKYDWVSQILGH